MVCMEDLNQTASELSKCATCNMINKSEDSSKICKLMELFNFYRRLIILSFFCKD